MGRQKRKPTGKAVTTTGNAKKRKEKGKTQTPPMQRIMVMGPTGKMRMEWRAW